MSETKPIWLLDVDGVINALSHPESWPDSQEGIAHLSDGSFKICWSPELIEEIKLLSKFIEIRWLTTWGKLANTALRPLVGLPDEFPVQAEPVYETGYGGGNYQYTTFDWKFIAAKEALKEGRPIIWTDDDAWTEDMKREICAEADSKKIPILMIRPQVLNGLSKNHISTIKEFTSFLIIYEGN